MRSFIIKPGDLIPIGRAGENQATEIRFDVTGWAETFGAGTFELIMQRPGDSELPYPVEVTVDGDYVDWTVSNVDTGIAGNCKVQLRYVVSDAIAKSAIYRGIVGESLDHAVDPPDPYDDLIERIEELARQTEQNAEAASRSAGNASDSADAAGRSAGNASDSADAAGRSANNAAQSVTDANAAKLAAQAAQQHAEAAQAGAEAAEARIMDTVPDAVTNWLNNHVDPATGYVIDDSLTIQNAAADAKAVGDALIDKAPVITDTASGAVASFPDGSDAPIKQLTVAVNPVQDLHGYDNPWPAGGGKNKLYVNSRVDKTVYGVHYTSDGDYIYMSGTKYGGGYAYLTEITITLPAGTYYAKAFTLGGSSTNAFTIYPYNDTLHDITGNILKDAVTSFTLQEETTFFFRFLISADNTVFTNLKVGIVISSSSDIATYSPYSNICPITGWTGAEVTRTWKNLLNKATMRTSSPGSRFAVFGVDSYSDTVPNGEIKLDAGNYTFSLSGANSTDAETIAVYDEANTRIKVTYNNKVSSFTVATAGYFRIVVTISSANFVSWNNYDIQLERGSTATAYEPYEGETYEIEFPDEAGTVYGTNFTVNQDGTGTLTVDRFYGLVTSATNKQEDTSGYYWYYTIGALSFPAIKGLNAKLVSDRLHVESNVTLWGSEGSLTIYANGIMRWKEQGSLSLADYRTYLSQNPFAVCYELATPITYTLSEELTAEITTLLGHNNVWANTGDTSVTYRADTKLYIDKKLSALLAALS